MKGNGRGGIQGAAQGEVTIGAKGEERNWREGQEIRGLCEEEGKRESKRGCMRGEVCQNLRG